MPSTRTTCAGALAGGATALPASAGAHRTLIVIEAARDVVALEAMS